MISCLGTQRWRSAAVEQVFERNGGGRKFDRKYRDEKIAKGEEARDWSDDRFLGLLRIFENTRGTQALRECREWHDPNRDTDYTDDIVADLDSGKLVIFDQALGDPVMNEQSAERIMRAIFDRQQQGFTNPLKKPDGSLQGPNPVVIYVEEAHTLLPRGSEDDVRNIWAAPPRRARSSISGLSTRRRNLRPSSATS